MKQDHPAAPWVDRIDADDGRDARPVPRRRLLLMLVATAFVALLIAGQVPPPSPSSTEVSRSLLQRQTEIEAEEAEALSTLARRLEAGGDSRAAGNVRRLLARAESSHLSDVSRFRPLPSVVGPAEKQKANASSTGEGLSSIPAGSGSKSKAGGAKPGPAASLGLSPEAAAIRSRAAAALFDLAVDAADETNSRFALADAFLREVLERDPNHAEARRLLGYVPYEGGWARPFAVQQFRDGFVDHETFGWVPKDWVPNLERGELPAPAPSSSSRSRRVRWLPAAQADALRAGWNPPWIINTEHFQVQTNVPLAEAIQFGRRLEAFYDLFFAMMADVIGENHPLVRRFRNPSKTGEASYRPHTVYYFATKDAYVRHLRPLTRTDVERSLGYYDPELLGRSKGNRVPAYFFRDVDGQLPVTATLYHEVSHQLLFESAGPNAYKKNVGNYWVFEGLGTYFETVSPQPDGTLEVGGVVGPRIETAIRELIDAGKAIPLERFVRLGQTEFNRDDQIYLHYQEAMAVTIFLMQARQQLYRDDFLEYVRDALRGRLKGTSGRSLDDWVGASYQTLDRELGQFLSKGRSTEPVRGTPATPDRPAGIRTLPSSASAPSTPTTPPSAPSRPGIRTLP
jgi:hypothetical protein